MFDCTPERDAHPSLTPQFVAAMDRAVARIEAQPERFAMRSWCGTACCIAGHLMEDVGVDAGEAGDAFDPCTWAADVFGFPAIAAMNLFIPLTDFDAIGPENVRRVWDHLRATGKVDWREGWPRGHYRRRIFGNRPPEWPVAAAAEACA